LEHQEVHEVRDKEKAKAQLAWITVFLVLVGILIAGCLPRHDRKEIDLDDWVSDAELRELAPETDTDVLRFGFDLRASPQEDARQYLPFLEYLTQYYPSSGIAANKDVPPEVLDRVRQALLDFDPQGRDAPGLYHWSRTEMVNGFIEATDDDYAELLEWAVKLGFFEEIMR